MLHSYSRMTQFHRDQASDSEEVATSFMQDGTYSPRNFATLGTLQPPFGNSTRAIVECYSFIKLSPSHVLYYGVSFTVEIEWAFPNRLA